MSDVWFQLVGSADGLPYKGTSADILTIFPTADIADFCDALQGRYADSLLNRIAPSQLVVYENKEAFDGNKPCRPDQFVDSLGKSHEDTLIVVVPSLIQAPQTALSTLSLLPLAQANDDFTPRKRQRRDIELREYCLATSQFFKDLPQFPQVQDLDLLLKPLPFRLDIIDPYLAKEVFAADAPLVECSEMTGLINNISIKHKQMPLSETPENDDWQRFYDLFILLMEAVCHATEFPIKVQRNKCDETTTRPDCLIRTDRGLVLCRGEEKCMRIGLQESLSELRKKMSTWNAAFYGELPYILGYATSGSDMSVVAIDRHQSLHEIVLNQSLYTSKGRCNLIKFFYNLAFFFQLMRTKSKRFTDIRLKPFTRYENNERTLEMVDSGIRRTYKKSAKDFYRYVNIYQTLKKINDQALERNHLQIVSEFEQEKNKLIVLLTPLGFEKRPLTLDAAREWIVGMLKALSYWHGSNNCHGDICWRNIVFVPTKTGGYWMLIDMDQSYRPETKKIDWNHKRAGDTLTFQHDLHQLGDLMKGFTFSLSEELKILKNKLLTSIDTEMTANELLLSLQ